ncbi:excalibur calcium-binding domain-containing protein [Arthrobacter sp. Ld5]|uniref:excalibur calcium-binding domain-containing protein n=1 Tax=Arthrobacter sp. Ld5 TaxID=649152 RepID=UPI003EB7D199
MNKRTGLLALAVTAGLSTFSIAPALATGPMTGPDRQVCGEGTSGKIDVSGGQTAIVVTAPEGQLIASYCVKAGSSKQGEGPQNVELVPPVSQVTISHASGKDISHYSYTLVPAPVVVTPEVPETPTPEVPETPAVPVPETPEVPQEPTPELPVEETPAEEPPVEVPEEETPVSEAPAEGAPVAEAPAEVPVTVEVPLTPVVVTDTPDNVLPVLDHAAAGVRYENCAEVRDVLGRSILLGEEGFRAGLDRDGDGVGCELETVGDRTTGSTTGSRAVLEGAPRTGQLAYTGTDDSVKLAGGIGAGLLALGAGVVLAGRGRHRAVDA